MKTFQSNFLVRDQADELVAKYGTPLFVYFQKKLEEPAEAALSIPAPFGLTVRYAVKANPNPEILKVLREKGIKIDASSGYEAELALQEGFEPADILLTSQQLPRNLNELLDEGIQFNATSLYQLEEYGKAAPNTDVSIRLNPGIGSGHSAKTNTGGITSSFGIWHEYIDEIQELAKRYGLTITRLHTHIGSGTDPAVWQQAAELSLNFIERFESVSVVDLGGGFKVARTDGEQGTDMKNVGQVIADELKAFHVRTGRKLHLEIEPGTFMVANSGILLCQVEDIVDTGKDGYTFLKLNTGMNDILRPSLYGAQHPIAALSDNEETQDYVIVGHNCESGDLLTPEPGKPETLATRNLPKSKIGDLVLIGGTGAYCASMAAHGYNSYPLTKSILV